MTVQRLTRSLFATMANALHERGFARQVEAAFGPDPEALARVRAAVMAQAAQLVKVEPGYATRRSAGSLAWRTSALAIVVVVAIVGGLAIANLGSAPAPGAIAVAALPLPSAAASMASEAPVDLGQSQASLASVLTTAQLGDASKLEIVLVSYEADLDTVAAELHRPGANVSAARAELLEEASDLASIAPSVTAADALLFSEARTNLAALIASLPVPAPPGHAKPGNGPPAAKPAPGHSHAQAPTPKPTKPPKHPGKDNGNGLGKDKGDDHGSGNGSGNDAGHANGNGHKNGQ